MAKVTKKSDLVIKTMLSSKERQSLKNKIKKAKEVHKKAEVNVKTQTKKLVAVDKLLKKAIKLAGTKKTPATKKAKTKATENVKKAKVKLRGLTQQALDKAKEVKFAELALLNAEKKEAAWQKAAAAFDKQWERDYDKKTKKKTAPRTTKKKSASKKVVPKKTATKATITKAVVEPPVERANVSELMQPAIAAIPASQANPVQEEPASSSAPVGTYPSVDDTAPLNPLPFPSGFGGKENGED